MRCLRCKNEKIDFSRKKNGDFQKVCDSCIKKQKEYLEKNRAKYREYNKRSYYKNKEKRLKKIKKYKEDHKEYYDKYFKEYRMENKEQIKKWHKLDYKFVRKQQHQTPEGRFDIYKRSAKNGGKVFELSFEQFMMFWKQPCFYCGNIPLTIGLDRVDNDKGYVIENVVSCCTTCNLMKKSLPQEVFINQCRLIAQSH